MKKIVFVLFALFAIIFAQGIGHSGQITRPIQPEERENLTPSVGNTGYGIKTLGDRTMKRLI